MNERSLGPEQIGLGLGVEAKPRPPKPMPAKRVGRASRRRRRPRVELPGHVERVKPGSGTTLTGIERSDPAENLGADPHAATEHPQFFDNDHRNEA